MEDVCLHIEAGIEPYLWDVKALIIGAKRRIERCLEVNCFDIGLYMGMTKDVTRLAKR
jgi:hypothetical protein